MASIEPDRLRRSRNDPQTRELPSIQSLTHTASTNDSLSLAPIEDDIRGHRRGQPGPQQIPSYDSLIDGLPSRQNTCVDGIYRSEAAASSSSTSVLPLQLRLLHPTYTKEQTEDATPKKRQRAPTVHQEFNGPLLPNPVKKRKSAQQVVPPIISGLLEPPQDAAVFPPIVGHYNDAEPSSSNPFKDYLTMDMVRPLGPSAEPDKPDKQEKATRGRAKRRTGKPRRKWSEEETKNLLLGVHKHGVGKWTSILEDPEYTFNDRTAGDLKDRFRTCCPAELREQLGRKDDSSERQKTTPKTKPQKSGVPLENILNEHILANKQDLGYTKKGPSSIASLYHDSEPADQKKSKGRAHRKNIEDLEVLGINAPFKRSERRERRPFTEQDDREILDGLRWYGPAWTKIQRDTRFHLSTRQPTDLRDRVRNKYPELYASIEKGSFHSIQQGRGTTKILEPSVNTSVGNLLPTTLDPHLNRTSSKENMSRSTLPSSGLMEPFESLPGIASFETADPSSSTFTTSGEEMAISRLMIQDSQNNTGGEYGGELLDGWSAALYGREPAERQPATTGQPEPPKSPGPPSRPSNPYSQRGFHQ